MRRYQPERRRLAAFLRVESRSFSPMLDLGLFRDCTFSASVPSATLNYICVYSLIFLMPFYLQQGRGLCPADAGRLPTAQPIIMALIAPLSGSLSGRMPAWVPSTQGMLILAMGAWPPSALGPSASLLQVAFGLPISGFDIGLFVSPNSNALMSSAPMVRQGTSAGVLATARNVGMVLGVGLASHRVQFATMTRWVMRLAASNYDKHLEPYLRQLERTPPIAIDEVGYIPFDAEAANLFFQLVSSRYERGSVIVTSNKPFTAWGEIFGDPVVAAAMIDRLVHHAEILPPKGDSYRLKDKRLSLERQEAL